MVTDDFQPSASVLSHKCRGFRCDQNGGFDAATLDPATGAMKASMQPNQTTGGPGELLHPNRVGYQAMAETIDPKLLAPSLSQ